MIYLFVDLAEFTTTNYICGDFYQQKRGLKTNTNQLHNTPKKITERTLGQNIEQLAGDSFYAGSNSKATIKNKNKKCQTLVQSK